MRSSTEHHRGDLGRRIAEQRDRAGLSREQAADGAGMAASYLEYLETSAAPSPERGALTRLAAALGTTAAALETTKGQAMSTQTLPGQESGSDMSDWAGSPLSTLHPAAAMAQPIRTEEYMKDDRYVVRFELPGIDPQSNIDVSIDAQVLTIHAERPVNGSGKYHSDFRYGLFCSHVTLPAGADCGDVAATYESGILRVSVGFEGKHAARKIEITPAG